MDENNAVGQTYESIMSDRFKMYKFRIHLGYIAYAELSVKIQFYIKRVRTLKDKIKKCQRMGSRLNISGKTVHILGVRALKAELLSTQKILIEFLNKRKDKRKEIMRLICERNDAYNKLQKLGKV